MSENLENHCNFELYVSPRLFKDLRNVGFCLELAELPCDKIKALIENGRVAVPIRFRYYL